MLFQYTKPKVHLFYKYLTIRAVLVISTTSAIEEPENSEDTESHGQQLLFEFVHGPLYLVEDICIRLLVNTLYKC